MGLYKLPYSGEELVANFRKLDSIPPLATDSEVMALLSKYNIITSVSDSTGYVYLDIDNKILVY